VILEKKANIGTNNLFIQAVYSTASIVSKRFLKKYSAQRWIVVFEQIQRYALYQNAFCGFSLGVEA